MLKALQGHAHVAISEIPLSNAAKYNNAIFYAGFVVSVLANCPASIIEVFPMYVKMAAVGHRQAVTEEMIEWAITKYPTAPCKTRIASCGVSPCSRRATSTWRMRLPRFTRSSRPVTSNK